MIPVDPYPLPERTLKEWLTP